MVNPLPEQMIRPPGFHLCKQEAGLRPPPFPQEYMSPDISGIHRLQDIIRSDRP